MGVLQWKNASKDKWRQYLYLWLRRKDNLPWNNQNLTHAVITITIQSYKHHIACTARYSLLNTANLLIY